MQGQLVDLRDAYKAIRKALFVKREKGSSVRKEYALSLDMAKELCMIENNEKGRTIRKYFIEVEKK